MSTDKAMFNTKQWCVDLKRDYRSMMLQVLRKFNVSFSEYGMYVCVFLSLICSVHISLPPTVLAPRKTIENILRREHTKSERRRSNLLRQQEDQFSKQHPFTPTLLSAPSFATHGRSGRSRSAPRYSNEIAADQAAAMAAAEEARMGGVAGLGDEEEKAAAMAAGVGEREVVVTVDP